MSAWEVCYFENGRVVTVIIRSAASASKAKAKADALVPDGAHLTTRRKLRSGARA